MRVSLKAFAPLSALFFASCITPPPMVDGSRSVAFEEGEGRGEAYASSQRGDRRPYAEVPDEGYVRDSGFRFADDRSDRYSDGRFDDGRFAIPLDDQRRGSTVVASYSPEPAAQAGNYDDGYIGNYDGGPSVAEPLPQERGSYASDPIGRISFRFGGRRIDDSAFREISDDLFAFAIDYSQVKEPGNIGFEFGFGIAGDDQDDAAVPASPNFPGGLVDVERIMAEVYAGLRTEFRFYDLRPYVGGGGVLLNVSERRGRFASLEDNDGAAGGYFHAGVEYDINDIFFVGVDYRQVFAGNVQLFDEEFDTDYRQVALTLGLTF